MVRLLIEDVTLTKGAEIAVHVRFRGGALRSIALPKPLPAVDRLRTDPAILAEIDRMLPEHTLNEIVAHLNERGMRTATGSSFNRAKVNGIAHIHSLKSRYHRLRERGLLTGTEVARLLGTTVEGVKKLYRQGRLRGQPYSEDGKCLYFPPEPSLIQKPTKTGDNRGAVSK